ncbi:unnamed protein product [Mytilus coruscus]|uniref:Uncharacterized protein n=1 Tax=Mytilus coruscus TaxID=42192 RepID=A0A6J8A2W3_MYTCO|nr:unnamed protein product [Mytilus coruscus]
MGPDFLCLPIERLPIRQDYTESNQLPDAVGITMSFEHEEKDSDIVPELSDIDLNRFSNVRKMLHVTSIILAIAKRRYFKGTANNTCNISTENVQLAEKVWRLAQIIEANVERDGLVRDVILRYKNVGQGVSYNGCEDQHITHSQEIGSNT